MIGTLITIAKVTSAASTLFAFSTASSPRHFLESPPHNFASSTGSPYESIDELAELLGVSRYDEDYNTNPAHLQGSQLQHEGHYSKHHSDQHTVENSGTEYNNWRSYYSQWQDLLQDSTNSHTQLGDTCTSTPQIDSVDFTSSSSRPPQNIQDPKISVSSVEKDQSEKTYREDHNRKYRKKIAENETPYWRDLMDKGNTGSSISLFMHYAKVPEGTARNRLSINLTLELDQHLKSKDPNRQAWAVYCCQFTPGDSLFNAAEREVIKNNWLKNKNGEKYQDAANILAIGRRDLTPHQQWYIKHHWRKGDEQYAVISNWLHRNYLAIKLKRKKEIKQEKA